MDRHRNRHRDHRRRCLRRDPEALQTFQFRAVSSHTVALHSLSSLLHTHEIEMPAINEQKARRYLLRAPALPPSTVRTNDTQQRATSTRKIALDDLDITATEGVSEKSARKQPLETTNKLQNDLQPTSARLGTHPRRSRRHRSASMACRAMPSFGSAKNGDLPKSFIKRSTIITNGPGKISQAIMEQESRKLRCIDK